MRENKKQLYAYRSFWPELKTRKRFKDEVGVTVHNVMISNTANSLGFHYTGYPNVWKWNGAYDLDSFDKQLDDVISVVPDARFLIMLDLNTPHWWTRYLGAFGVRYDSFYELGKISACELWRQDTAEYMRTVMEHAQKKYGDRIEGYVLGCGGATEWHDRSRSEESIYKLDAFRKWQKANGKEMTDIPGRMRRDSGSYDFCKDYVDTGSYYNGNDPTGGAYESVFPNGFGLFRSPEKDQDVIDYLKFCAELNVETVSYFLKEARTVIPEDVELGCFFGYCMASWSMSACHLAYEKLLQNPDIDFVIAPVIQNSIGEGSVSATVHKTIELAGKRMLQEFDQKVWCYNRKMSDCCTLPAPKLDEEASWSKNATGKDIAKNFTFGGGNGWTSPKRTAEGIKRDSSMALMQGDSLWWFDMWGGFYQHDEVYEALTKSHEIYKQEIHDPGKSVEEALVVYDPENLYLINDMNERAATFHAFPRRALGKCGIPYDVCSLNDLKKMDMTQYKLIVLCHEFQLTDEKMALLREKVLNSGRTVLWIYGPVIGKDGKWNPENVEKVCGIPYGTDGVPTRDMGDWKSAYAFRTDKVINENVMRDLAVKAGCHIWSSRPAAIRATSRFVCVHAVGFEPVTVTLPEKAAKITELYSGKVWENTDQVTFEVDEVATYFLKMEY